ncbi:hypothetical protein [Maricaulis sp.]|uniref:hypothetical protein n=1 Tax=Maricaulis sp. TaxID=1486257 RepID=UPI002625F137|nr:hypothetical protein [Maricaulis sp.]
MKFVPVFSIFSVVLAGCSTLDMPVIEGSNAEWIEERRLERQGEGAAPVSVPVYESSPIIRSHMNVRMIEVLEQRDALIAESEELDDEAGADTEEFLRNGQARTTPPQGD